MRPGDIRAAFGCIRFYEAAHIWLLTCRGGGRPVQLHLHVGKIVPGIRIVTTGVISVGGRRYWLLDCVSVGIDLLAKAVYPNNIGVPEHVIERTVLKHEHEYVFDLLEVQAHCLLAVRR